MSLTIDEREAVVTYRIEKSERLMEQVKGIAPLKYWETIANRLYYAAYYAVSALLIANGDTAQTHGGIIGIFGLHFVKEGKVSVEMGNLYKTLYAMRLTGDYDDFGNLTAENVQPLIAPTEEFIKSINTMSMQLIANSRDKGNI